MNAKEIKEAADAKRVSAKRSLNKMFDVGDGCGCGMVEGIVDDIVACAMLEISAVHMRSIETE